MFEWLMQDQTVELRDIEFREGVGMRNPTHGSDHKIDHGGTSMARWANG